MGFGVDVLVGARRKGLVPSFKCWAQDGMCPEEIAHASDQNAMLRAVFRGGAGTSASFRRHFSRKPTFKSAMPSGTTALVLTLLAVCSGLANVISQLALFPLLDQVVEKWPFCLRLQFQDGLVGAQRSFHSRSQKRQSVVRFFGVFDDECSLGHHQLPHISLA